MSTTIDQLKEQLKTMLDSTENKEQIASITSMSNLVDKLNEEHTALQNEQKELLKDYKEVIKHTSFKPNGTEQEQVKTQSTLTFDSFLADYKKPDNGNK